MKKIWEVTVNNWGWDAPRTLFFESREAAEKAAEKYPGADKVKYSGNFSTQNAKMLLGK